MVEWFLFSLPKSYARYSWIPLSFETKIKAQSRSQDERLQNELRTVDESSFPNTHQLSHHHSNQWHRLRSFFRPCCVDSLNTRQSQDGSLTCRVRYSGTADSEENPSYEEDRGYTAVHQPWFCRSTGLSANHRDCLRRRCCRSYKLTREKKWKKKGERKFPQVCRTVKLLYLIFLPSLSWKLPDKAI